MQYYVQGVSGTVIKLSVTGLVVICTECSQPKRPKNKQRNLYEREKAFMDQLLEQTSPALLHIQQLNPLVTTVYIIVYIIMHSSHRHRYRMVTISYFIFSTNYQSLSFSDTHFIYVNKVLL